MAFSFHALLARRLSRKTITARYSSGSRPRTAESAGIRYACRIGILGRAARIAPGLRANASQTLAWSVPPHLAASVGVRESGRGPVQTSVVLSPASPGCSKIAILGSNSHRMFEAPISFKTLLLAMGSAIAAAKGRLHQMVHLFCQIDIDFGRV